MTGLGDLLDFSDRVVLVAGGASPLREGIGERFRRAGAHVATADDLRDPEQADAFVTGILVDRGRLDVVVHCVGDDPGIAADTAPAAAVSDLIARDLLAGIHLSQRANAAMQEQAGGGSIIHVAALTARRPRPGTALHSAAAGGLVGLVPSLAVEWGPKVRVNSISVGPVGAAGDDHVPDHVPPVPLGRLATPTDVGDACVYLGSPMAAYVSGADLVLHGGGEWPPFLAAADPASG